MVGSTQRLELKQGQNLVMTPQLQQSLKLLQCSNQELMEYVEEEIEKNPLLEKDESTPQDVQSENSDAEEATSQMAENAAHADILDVGYEGSWESNGDKIDDQMFKSPAEESQSLHINTGVSDSYQYGGSGESFFEQILTEQPSLRDHLLDQVNLDFNEYAQKMIAAYLIDGLDVSGYYIVELQEVARALECNILDVENVLEQLQKCDPIGIFAKDLKECLMLQLIEKNRYDPAMEKLLNNLPLIEKGEMRKLRKICKVDNEDFDEMLKELRQLNPRPASKFSVEVTQNAQIDIYIRRNPDGVWAIELNNETLPRVLVNNKYYSEVKKKANNKYEKEFVMEQYNTANWLVKTLNQRAQTILKVTTELVAQQKDFFEQGIYYLKPMVLADIAKEVGIHESTVGRVTNNKYISTPRGVFELKYFFSSAIVNSGGAEDFSSKTVKFLIKELIDDEAGYKSVLSDDKISDILKAKNVDVARRTVAKYRESMDISSSAIRKRQHKMKAGLI